MTPGGGPALEMTNAQWAAAIRRAAAHLCVHLPTRSKSHGIVVAFCAHADVLDYLCLTLGTELAGLVGLHLANNSPPQALVHLIREADAHFLLAGPPGKVDLDARLKQAMHILHSDGWDLTLIPWPSRDVLASGPELNEPIAPYEPDRPVLILHSSGTTGVWPKLRVHSQRAIRQLQLGAYFSPGIETNGVTFVGNLPPFHSMIHQVIRWAPVTGNVLAGYAWSRHPRPVDEQSWLHGVLATKTTVAPAPPSMFENALCDPALISLMRNVPNLVYGGACLAPQTERLALEKHGIRLASVFGSTETFCVTAFTTPSLNGPGSIKTTTAPAFLRPIPGDSEGAVEMLWYSTPHFAPLLYNGEWEGRPTYSTGHRFKILSHAVPHDKVISTEQLSGEVRLKALGRLDDMVPLSNGENVNPGPLLDALLPHPDVQHVIVFGKLHPQAGVLIQLRSSSSLLPRKDGAWTEWDAASLSRAREALWPLVQQANAAGPSHARITREMMVLASADRPFVLTGKNSVRSVLTLDLYAADIEQAYASVSLSDEISVPKHWTKHAALTYVCALLSACLEQDITPAQQDEDLFQTLGADSVVATKMWQALASALPASAGQQLPGTLVYDHPTPAALATAVYRTATGGAAAATASPDPLAIMARLIEQYSTFPPAAPKRQAPKHTIIVTGTTGSMGCHLLAQLLGRPDVEAVYALNRPGAPLHARQAQALETQGLDVALANSPKLRLTAADWTHEAALARDVRDYKAMMRATTHIIHAAWKLDFAIPVQSFEKQIAGVQTLAAVAARTGAHITFISSVGCVQRSPNANPGEELHPLSWAQGGYGRSKAVAEHILDHAAKAGVGATVLRAGQLTGATTVGSGAWNTSEWFPALTQVSQRLHAVPLLQGRIDWLPMDRAAGTVVDVTLAHAQGVLHLTNARPSELQDLVRGIADMLRLPLLPPSAWLDSLGALDDSKYAATRLLPFLRDIADHGMVLLTPSRTVKASSCLAHTQPLDRRDVSRWVAFWRNQGFIQ